MKKILNIILALVGTVSFFFAVSVGVNTLTKSMESLGWTLLYMVCFVTLALLNQDRLK